MSGILNKHKITMELTRKLVELDEVAAEDDDILEKFERQHEILSLLVDKAKNRLINYKPIRSALLAPKKHDKEDVDIRQMIQQKAKTVETLGEKMKYERFLEHESIKFQGDLFNPVNRLDEILQNTNNKENEINNANLEESDDEDSDIELSKNSENERIEEDLKNHKRVEDRTIRERVEIMRKRKFCVF